MYFRQAHILPKMVSDSEKADQLGKTEGFPLSRPESVGQDRTDGAEPMAPLFLETGEHTMRRRMLAAALACTLLAGCGPVRTEPVEQETPRPVRR